MRYLRWLLVAAAFGSGFLLLLSFPMESTYASKADLYQRVMPSEGASLFGDVGELVGEPQQYIVGDPAAILADTTDEGVKLLDQNYIDEQNVSLVQLQTVRFIASQVRMAGIGALLFSLLSLGVIAGIMRRRALAAMAAHQAPV
jgi:hypothetical protein